MVLISKGFIIIINSSWAILDFVNEVQLIESFAASYIDIYLFTFQFEFKIFDDRIEN